MNYRENLANYAAVEDQIRAARIQRAVYLAEAFASAAEAVIVRARRLSQRLGNLSGGSRTRKPA